MTGYPYDPNDLNDPNHPLTVNPYTDAGDSGAATSIAPGIVLLIIVFYVFAGAVMAAVGSLIGAVAIMALTKLFAWDKAPGYRAAYRASFMGMFAYLMVGFVLSLFPGFAESAGAMPEEPSDFVWTDFPKIVFVQTPGTIAFAIAMRKRLGEPYTGFFGFFRACIVAFITILSTLLLLLGGAMFFEGPTVVS